MIPCPCPKCRAVFQLPDQYAGAVVACPLCRESFQAPAVAPTAAAIAPAWPTQPAPPTLLPPVPAPPAPRSASAWPREVWWIAGGLAAFLVVLVAGLGVLVAMQWRGNPDPIVKNGRPTDPNPPVIKPPEETLPPIDDATKPKPRPTPKKFAEAPPDPKPYLIVQFAADDRFGIRLAEGGKQLTFAANGSTNNTSLLIDRLHRKFVGSSGTSLEYVEGDSRGWRSVNTFPGSIRVTQDISIRRGEQSRKLDTCQILYTVENHDDRDHEVGLRLMIDTLIGKNDGVPFTIPVRSGLCDTYYVCDRAADMPDYVQALERPNLSSPGTVAQLGLRLPARLKGVEPADELALTRWPGSDPPYRVPVSNIQRDSAAVLYWAEKTLRPGGVRRMACTYGQGGVAAAGGGGRLALTAGGSFSEGGDFTLTAYVEKPGPRQRVTLTVPAPALRLLDAGGGEREVPPPTAGQTLSQVSWRVRAVEEGKHTIKARLDNGAEQTLEVTIHKAFTEGTP